MSKKLKFNLIYLLPLICVAVLYFMLNKYDFKLNKIIQTDNGIVDVNDSEFSIHFLDVGDADSILIINNDINILVDAADVKPEGLITSYLKSQNVKDIRFIFLTHPHRDHYGQMEDVINNFKVEHFIISSKSNDEPIHEGYSNLINKIRDKNIIIESVKMGKHFDLGELKIDVISPCKAYKNTNDNSLVLKITFKNIIIILTGDAQIQAEKDILKNNKKNLKANILKIGHHGSNSSTSLGFVKAINPEIAVISAGRRLDSHLIHPSEKILEKLKELKIQTLVTKDEGNIVGIYKNNNLEIKTSKSVIKENLKAA